MIVRTPEEFGAAVLQARKAGALRQVEAAHLIGVSPPVLNKLENGKEVWLSKAIDVCNALGIEIVLNIPSGGDDNA